MDNSNGAEGAAVLTAWARLLLGSLARAGVEHAVISPGSRSTPFTWAALETPGLTCHSVLDERSAAFFALGQAKACGKPSLLICTSGSAAAQYYPAIVEASASAIPLLALTADRPVELQEAGAQQCLDQSKLFGSFVRRFLELGHPDASTPALDGVVRMSAQAVAAALGPLAGPVHLNAKARKPLEPTEAALADGPLAAAVESRLRRGPTSVVRPIPTLTMEQARELVELCAGAARGLIVCGPMERSPATGALFELARASGYPLAMEATSQGRFDAALPQDDPSCAVIGGFEALAAAGFLRQHAPELVLVVGSTPASAQLERWLAQGTSRYIVISPHGHQDPVGRACCLVQGQPFQVAAALAAALRDRLGASELEPRRQYAAAWRRADNLYYSLLDEILPAEGGPLTEPIAVRTVLDALPARSWLALGNSLPVREVDAFVRPRAAEIAVFSQRGLAGIDGLVSGALGVASATSRPGVALLGDVSFLHDVSGLALAKEARVPLAIVVLDNGGGRIFETLPVARLLQAHPDRARFWLTPHDHDLRHAAAFYGVPYQRAEDRRQLAAGLRAALERPGATLVHVIVPADSCRNTVAAIAGAFGERLAR